MSQTDYTFLLEIHDTPGLLMRIAQVFGRRGGNIRALNVQPPTTTSWSTMTIVATNIHHADQIKHQLEKLVDVHSATVLSENSGHE